ncbi:hypothetical protein [Actinomadura opuntiae]|uniref:hypothetical protein n=1 Tax=Actinomadura sp. OS1-43 TaxID=604315 RepID=UPI00255AA8F7|nr:hypothetical protein [Actinomadura sp. OS1-43]MDL4819327.1 hypothetical protein [Actinomadura sp. OS1-43]
MAKSRVPRRPLAVRVIFYAMGGVLYGVLMRIVMAPDASWILAGCLGLGFAVLFGLLFDAWYRRRIFRQDMEDETR